MTSAGHDMRSLVFSRSLWAPSEEEMEIKTLFGERREREKAKKTREDWLMRNPGDG